MPYEVNNTRGTLVATVLDGTLNTTSSSLSLIGQGKSNYGEALNENLWALLENFASATPPSSPIKGQIWFDTSINILKVKINENEVTDEWVEIGSSGIDSGVLLPGSGDIGDLFWHTAESALYVWNGTAWQKLYPSNRIQNTNNTSFVESDLSQHLIKVVLNSITTAEFKQTNTLFNKQFRAAFDQETTVGATTWDCETQQVLSITLNNNTTLNISKQLAGSKYTLIVKQDSTGGRSLTFNGSQWLWPTGTAPAISTVANSITVMEFVCNGPNVILLTIQGGSEGAGAGNPIGTVATFAGSTPPANWLICDGSTVSRTEWLDLFNVIGVTYGAGNGSTTFNLPDARGRAIIGAGQGTGLSNRSLGTTGGTETQAITIDQLAAHTHTANHSHTGTTDSAGAHTHTVPLGGPAGASGGDRVYPQTGSQNTGSSGAHTHTLSIASANVTSSSVGAGQPHNNMQPFITMNYIIFGGSNSA